MSLIEVLPSVQVLSRREKLQLIELLAQDLARGEDSPLEAGQSFPVWSPHDAYEAAAVLMQAIEDEKRQA
jgi:hypothetical protein